MSLKISGVSGGLKIRGSSGRFSASSRAAAPAGSLYSGTIIVDWDFRNPGIALSGSKIALLPAGPSSTVLSNLEPYYGNPTYSFGYYPTRINGQAAGHYEWVYMLPTPQLSFPASDWLIGFVLDVVADGWLLDIGIGRLLIGNKQTYTDANGFSSSAPFSPGTGVQIITAEFRAGTSSLRYYPQSGSPLGPYCVNGYSARPFGSSYPAIETLGATYINSDGADAYYGQVIIIRNPGAGDEATLASTLKTSWGI